MRTVGAEEEFLLFDRGSTRLARLGDALADHGVPAAPAGPLTDRTIEHEFKRAQIETASRPQEDMTALHADVATGRREVARRAAPYDTVLAALGTDPAPGALVTTDDPRYRRMTRLYGAVADRQLACGLHVHVSVASPDEGVSVIDRLRGWLPILLALSANSPYHAGEDTAYASYRTVLWGLWPTSGPTEPFGSVAAYREHVEELIRSGAAVDEGMIYFDARLSASYPTVEIRVMDVPPTPDDVVVLAALARGLVETVAIEARVGRPAPALSRGLVRAMTWRAARFGLTGELVQPDGSATAAAEDVVTELVRYVEPALSDAGDADLVRDGVRDILARGNGATRQRAALARRGRLSDVVAAAVAWTTPQTEL